MKVKNFRWWIAGMLMLSTALNYLDRQNLPMVISELSKEISIDNIAFSRLNFMFLLAYGLMYMGGGKIIDWLGPKNGLILMVLWWSVANAMHGLVTGVIGLFIARFLLGVGEGGGFPGCAKAVSEWFPPKERAFAFGLFNTGSSIGAMLAPPLIAFIVLSSSWRWVFYLTGLLGVVWVIFWYLIYQSPGKSKFLTQSENEFIGSEIVCNKDFNIRWIKLFSYRQLWGLLTAKVLVDSAWYFIIFWLPKYLSDSRGLNIKEIGSYAWIPYACAGAGSLIGGWLSNFLIKKNISIDISRKISLGIAAAVMPVSLFITNAPIAMAIVFFSISMFGHQFFSTIIQTTVTDLFPKKVVGAVAGLAGSFGSFGAMFFSLIAGQIIQQFGYAPVFAMVGLMHPIAFVLLMILVKKFTLVRQLV